jgi:hypothetical protein
MLKIPTILIFVLLLGACSTMPSGPSVLALPGTGKNFDVFHNDDQSCRQFVHSQIGTAQDKPDSREEAQQNYDIGYIQCMYGKGHRVPVPEELLYSTQQEWYPPPPPDMPAPQQPRSPGKPEQ